MRYSVAPHCIVMRNFAFATTVLFLCRTSLRYNAKPAGMQMEICAWHVKPNPLRSICSGYATTNNVLGTPFCYDCAPKRPPPSEFVLKTCRVCSHKALWCSAHCTEAELAATLCRRHYDLHANLCSYCLRPQKGMCKNWMPCRTADCSHEIYACDGCVSSTAERGLNCKTSWGATDKLCIARDNRLSRCYKDNNGIYMG